MNQEKINKQIFEQLGRLEKVVFAVEKDKSKKPKSKQGYTEVYSGPKGGTLLLIKEGFFKKKQTIDTVKKALEREGYDYHKDVVRNVLNRLSVKNGPLTTRKEGKAKIYVERK